MSKDVMTDKKLYTLMMEWLESQEFYELMQAYRTAPIAPQEIVCQRFAEVKSAISGHAEAREGSLRTLSVDAVIEQMMQEWRTDTQHEYTEVVVGVLTALQYRLGSLRTPTAPTERFGMPKAKPAPQNILTPVIVSCGSGQSEREASDTSVPIIRRLNTENAALRKDCIRLNEQLKSEREAGRREGIEQATRMACQGCANGSPLESNVWHKDSPHACKSVAIRALAAKGGKQP